MNTIAGDGRFEIIAKAKQDLIESTNIEQSEDEMKVLDDFLFRCWQMGWLDKYDWEIPSFMNKPRKETIMFYSVDGEEYIFEQ